MAAATCSSRRLRAPSLAGLSLSRSVSLSGKMMESAVRPDFRNNNYACVSLVLFPLVRGSSLRFVFIARSNLSHSVDRSNFSLATSRRVDTWHCDHFDTGFDLSRELHCFMGRGGKKTKNSRNCEGKQTEKRFEGGSSGRSGPQKTTDAREERGERGSGSLSGRERRSEHAPAVGEHDSRPAKGRATFSSVFLLRRAFHHVPRASPRLLARSSLASRTHPLCPGPRRAARRRTRSQPLPESLRVPPSSTPAVCATLAANLNATRASPTLCLSLSPLDRLSRTRDKLTRAFKRGVAWIQT